MVRSPGSRPAAPHVPLADLVPRAAPGGPLQRHDRVLGQAERLAHLAHGALGPIGDDRGRHAGPLAAVLPVDVLDHLLAPLVLEVHVDVGGLAPLGADEALEQEVDALGVDGGDAEAVADRRVGGRAPPLTEDAPIPGEADDVVDGEEVGGEAEPVDQLELVLDQGAHRLRHATRIALPGAGPGEPLQLLLRRASRGDRVHRVLVAELVEAEAAGLGHLDRAGDGVRMAMEQPRHLVRALEVALGVGEQPEAGRIDGRARADAGEHVLQRPAGRGVGVHVVGGDEGRAARPGHVGEDGEPAGIVAPVEHMGGEID